MKETEFSKQYKNPIVLALGMFDCVHIAHAKLIENTKALAKQHKAQTAVFTFKNNPTVFYNKPDKLVYGYADRLERFLEEGVDVVIYKSVDAGFSKMPGLVFLDALFNNFNILGIVCGEDFTFGKDALGNAKLLEEYCNKKNISLKIIKTVMIDDVKMSTSFIKKLLIKGEIEKANSILGKAYRISGVVINGDGLGGKLLYPTANICFDADKTQLLCGVYETQTLIDGKLYKSVTNFGAKPTFDKDNMAVETHIIDLEKSLYDKKITVFFIKRIRDIIKFENINQLKKQIEKDINIVKQG